MPGTSPSSRLRIESGNEDRYFERLDDYDAEGRQFKDRFRKLGDDEFEAWRRSARTSDEVILVEP